MREPSAQLSDAYAVGQHGELVLLNAQIPQYGPAGPLGNHEPKRTRKPLPHRREIDKPLEKQQKAGYALVPLSIYFQDGIVKVELGGCKGKAGPGQREASSARESQ